MRKHKAVVAYVPVLHQGYLNFFKEQSQPGDCIYIIPSGSLVTVFPDLKHLKRNLCEVSTGIIEAGLKIFFTGQDARVIVVVERIEDLETQLQKHDDVIMPKEDVSEVILKHFRELRSKTSVKKVFLRWDKNASLMYQEVNVAKISGSELPMRVVSELKRQMDKSVDWWRQVACVVYDNQGTIVLAAYNRHLPSDQTLNIFGDARFNFKQGEHIESCTAIHAEVWAIAQAAKRGISLEGLNMLVSDFPCPPCAKSIAFTGIKNLYFVQGYSKTHGQETLEGAGIQIQQVVFEK